MSIDQRLSRLAPALSAQERAILVLEAWKDGRQEDPAWRLHMPQEQAKAFNYYIDLMNKANGVLGRLVSHLHVEAEKVELREGWLLSLTVWQDHVDEISQAVHAEVKAPAGRKRLEAVLDWRPSTSEGEVLPTMPASVIEMLKKTTAYGLISTWVEMKCVEVLVEEIAGAFNGIDPLRPVFREKLESTREKLLTVHEHLSFLSIQVELREPLGEELQEMREWLESLPNLS